MQPVRYLRRGVCISPVWLWSESEWVVPYRAHFCCFLKWLYAVLFNCKWRRVLFYLTHAVEERAVLAATCEINCQRAKWGWLIARWLEGGADSTLKRVHTKPPHYASLAKAESTRFSAKHATRFVRNFLIPIWQTWQVIYDVPIEYAWTLQLQKNHLLKKHITRFFKKIALPV